MCLFKLGKNQTLIFNQYTAFRTIDSTVSIFHYYKNGLSKTLLLFFLIAQTFLAIKRY